MAIPLPEEKQLYERIKNEGVKIEPGIWDLIYHRIGDYISAINLICEYYLKGNKPVPTQDANRIIEYTKEIEKVYKSLIKVPGKDFPFPEFKDNVPLHPIIIEMFGHYIGNDINVITIIAQDAIDPIEPTAISIENIQKILERTRTLKEFLERLRQATS